MTHELPVALTIAGSDCSAGAGIQADLKTFQHFHVHGLTALTCVVSETSNVVRRVFPLPVDLVADQISLLLESFPVAAIKTGMLVSAAHVRAVVEILKQHPEIPLVVDPVMISTTGTALLEADAVEACKQLLFPIARLITPNLSEAETLLGERIADETALESAARRLSEQYGVAVLLKGGHLPGRDSIDLLVDKGELFRFTEERIPVTGSHGTGCTLSAAVTAALAHGETLAWSVEQAKGFIGEALRRSYGFQSPSGGMIHALDQGTRPKKNET